MKALSYMQLLIQELTLFEHHADKSKQRRIPEAQHNKIKRFYKQTPTPEVLAKYFVEADEFEESTFCEYEHESVGCIGGHTAFNLDNFITDCQRAELDLTFTPLAIKRLGL